MQVHANLTVHLIRHDQFGLDRLQGLGPRSVLELPVSFPVDQVSRVDVVRPCSVSPDCVCLCQDGAEPAGSVITPPGSEAMATSGNTDSIPAAEPMSGGGWADSGGGGMIDVMA